MYSELENDVYTISTRDGSLKMEVGEYDMERTLWPVSFSGTFFDKHVNLEKDIHLLYSTLMERRYVARCKNQFVGFYCLNSILSIFQCCGSQMSRHKNREKYY